MPFSLSEVHSCCRNLSSHISPGTISQDVSTLTLRFSSTSPFTHEMCQDVHTSGLGSCHSHCPCCQDHLCPHTPPSPSVKILRDPSSPRTPRYPLGSPWTSMSRSVTLAVPYTPPASHPGQPSRRPTWSMAGLLRKQGLRAHKTPPPFNLTLLPEGAGAT